MLLPLEEADRDLTRFSFIVSFDFLTSLGDDVTDGVAGVISTLVRIFDSNIPISFELTPDWSALAFNVPLGFF